MADLLQRYRETEATILAFLRREHRSILKAVVGLVFLWFGFLKVIGQSPVEQLVAQTVVWFDPNWFIPTLGAVESLIGLGLILDRGLRVVLVLFLAQMAGTFLVLVIQPDVAFRNGNPFLLTTEGEFVIKNLVLVAAGLTIAAGLRQHPQGTPKA